MRGGFRMLKMLFPLLLGLITFGCGEGPGLGETSSVKNRLRPKSPERDTIDVNNRPISNLSGEEPFFVQLDVPSVAQFAQQAMQYGGAFPVRARQSDHARMIDMQHQGVRRALEHMGVKHQAGLRVGVNGIMVSATAKDVAAILNIPGVKSVARIAHHSVANESSVPWTGAPEVWSALGATGKNVTIAVIDTGVDYLHANFGGSGDPAEYAANNKEIIEPDTFPTAKVIGGYDFAGSAYDSQGKLGPKTPSPDPDPLDVGGHGSHVAGTAAGFGIEGKIGPGVAPDALIYALKVFGDSGGSTSLTSLAIEWALDPNGDGSTDDHVDVINMSLGSNFGSPNDPTALAAQHAADLGIIVVASAGNSGDVSYITGSPAVAPGAISVANSVDGGFGVIAMVVNPGSSVAGLYPATEGSIGPPLSVVGPVTSDVIAADPLEACSPLLNDLTGKIALIQRGSCSFTQKHQSAHAAGAIGVIVFNNEAGGDDLINMGGDAVPLPGMFIGHTGGLAILVALDNAETVNASIQTKIEIPKPELTDTLAASSSRGPGRSGSGFKPDLSAPGYGIRSAAVGSGVGYTNKTGTSMAAPHVAGAGALLHQLYPDLPPAGVKAMLQNSTNTAYVKEADSDNPYPLSLQGTGVLRVDQAAGLEGFASPGGLSFGRLNPTVFDRLKAGIEITNLSEIPQLYSITNVANRTKEGVYIAFPSYVYVPARTTRNLHVKMYMQAGLDSADDGFYSQSEVDGWLMLDNGRQQLRVGYLAVVDSASSVDARARRKNISVYNRSKTLGWAEAFTLVGVDGQNLDEKPQAIEALGVRTGEIEGKKVVEFGLATEKPWDAPSGYEVDIYLDTNEDGVYEYLLAAFDLGWMTDKPPMGKLATGLFDLINGGGLVQYFVNTDFNDQVMVLTVDRHGEAGFLDESDQTFAYRMEVHNVMDGSFDVQEGNIDLAQEVVLEKNSFGLQAREYTRIGVTQGSGKTLWLFANNPAGRQSKIVGE